MNLPKISVVTPSFNQGDFLEETILSVLNQNYPDLEYVIIDGGSRDGSVEIIKKYASRIKYWISETDNGQSAALNKGFAQCTGDIVTWLNSDDCYREGTLHKVAHYFNQGDYSLVYGKAILFGEKRKELVKGVTDERDVLLKCLAFVPFPQPSAFFKKEVLAEQGNLDETLHYGMDHDLFARIALNYDLLGVDDVFSKYRFHETGKSNFPLKFAEERTKVFSKVLRSFPEAGNYIQLLRELGYYNEGKDSYQVSTRFSAAELKKAFIYFLEVQMHYYYSALDLKNSKGIAKYLLRYNDPLVHKADARKVYLRSALLNKYFISFVRKLRAD